MFKMKTKIILLLFVAVFISSAILLYMVTNTIKKDKISYVYEVITSQTQSLAHLLQNEIETSFLLTSRLALKNPEDRAYNELTMIHYFSIIQILDNKPDTITEYLKPTTTKDPVLFDEIVERIKKIDVVDQKNFFLKNGIIYEIALTQLLPDKVATVIGFESEVAAGIAEEASSSQFGFVLGKDMEVIAGNTKYNSLLNEFIEKNRSKKWNDSQSGKMNSSNSEIWIYSLSNVAGTDLKVVNFVAESKAFAVMKTIYLKSFVSFILILSLVVIIGIVAATYLTEKLNLLTLATKKVTLGKLDTEITVTGGDEIASLSTDFNQMVKQIKKLMSETADQARMESELKTAQLVQENLFPEANHVYSNCQIEGYCKSASECGGDWWFHAEDDTYVNFIIADATGHGVSAALMTSAIKSAFILTTNLHLSPSERISRINEALCEVGRHKVMMTAFFMRINKKTNEAEYINASHEAPFILDLKTDMIEKSQIVFLNENSSARLGQASDTSYVASKIQLSAKQRLFFYTDGIFDLKNDAHKNLPERAFYKKVLELANEKSELSAYSEGIKKFIFDYHTQKTLDDDVTVCHIEII